VTDLRKQTEKILKETGGKLDDSITVTYMVEFPFYEVSIDGKKKLWHAEQIVDHVKTQRRNAFRLIKD